MKKDIESHCIRRDKTDRHDVVDVSKHIHTWNDYNEKSMLCCSTCGMTFNKYLIEEKK